MKRILLCSFLILTGCKSENGNFSMEFISSSGKEVAMAGTWESGCVLDSQNHLKERFEFIENQFTIYIYGFSDSECKTQLFADEVIVEFQIKGTIEVNLEDEKVIANKISGSQLIISSQEKTAFKQTIYVNDEDELFFYHSRFGSDGGNLSEDGFPIDLIPIKIKFKG